MKSPFSFYFSIRLIVLSSRHVPTAVNPIFYNSFKALFWGSTFALNEYSCDLKSQIRKCVYWSFGDTLIPLAHSIGEHASEALNVIKSICTAQKQHALMADPNCSST